MAGGTGGIVNVEAMVSAIAAQIKAKVNAIMRVVAVEIQRDLAARAASEVYGAYSPKIYARRNLLSSTGYYSVEIGDLQIMITPIAPFNRAYGGWNSGDELGGFMNFGRGWHGYVMGRGASDVPLPRPYISNAVEYWDGELQSRIKGQLGEWADCVTAHVTLGGE